MTRKSQVCLYVVKATQKSATKIHGTPHTKIGTPCVHVSAIWKFNDDVGKKATHAL